MRRFVATVGVASFMAGGAFALYRYALTDEDRDTIKRAIDSVKALAGAVWERVQPVIEDMASTSDVVDTTNRDATRRQWSELGY